MPTADELAQRFAGPIAALYEAVRRERPELSGVIEDGGLLEALARHAPDGDAARGYLESCRAPELALAVAASRGQPAAIAMLEREHRAAIETVCRRFAGPSQSVDDLRQVLREALLVGERPRLVEYAGRGRLDGWIRIAAVRIFIDLGRRKDRPREAPSEDGPLALPDPQDLSLEIVKAEYRGAVKRAMLDAAGGLELPARHLLHQHFVAGLSIDQLGAALGIHRATAARRIERARTDLVATTRELLANRLQLSPEELDEVMGLVMSRLDVSMTSLFGDRARGPG